MLANRHLPLLLAAALLAVACADRPLAAPYLDPAAGRADPDDDDLQPCPDEDCGCDEGCDDGCDDPPPCGCEDDCIEEECAPPEPRCPENPDDDLCRTRDP